MEDRSLPRDLLITPYRHCGAADAVESLEELMWLLDRGAKRCVQIGRPFRRELSDDELQLLAALRLASAGEAGRVRAVLERIGPPAFARMAARLLDGYARAIAAAGLCLAQRPEIAVIETESTDSLALGQAT